MLTQILERASLAWRVVRGGPAEALEHFRRLRAGSGAARPGPASPYSQVAIVRAAIERKATALASMPLVHSLADDRIVESGPLAQLARRPHTDFSGRRFWAATSALIDLTGACHWIMPRESLTAGRPTAILPVGATQLRRDREDRWLFRPAGIPWHEAIPIEPDEFHTVGLDAYDPEKPHGWSSPLDAAAGAVNQIYKADVANEASLDNGVEPGGILTMPGQPSEAQIRDMRQTLAEREGPQQRRRAMLLYGGVSWERMAASFSEMEFSELKRMSTADALSALAVDPAVIGHYENSNYAHAEAAKASFWIDVVLARAQWFAEEWENAVVAKFARDQSLSLRDALATARPRARSLRASGLRRAQARAPGMSPGMSPEMSPTGIRAWFDDSEVPAVRAAQLSRAKEGALWVNTFLAPPADVIEALDLPLPIHPHQRIAYQPIGLMPVGSPSPETLDPPGPPGPPGPGSEDDALGEAPPEPRGSPQEPEGASGGAVARALDEAALAGLWRRWRLSWAPLERAMEGRVGRHLTALRAGCLRRLAALPASGSGICGGVSGGVSGGERRDLVGSVLFDLIEANKALVVQAGPILRAAAQLGGQQSVAEAHAAANGEPGQEPVFRAEDPAVAQILRAREIRIAETNRTLRRELAEDLAAGVDALETSAQLAERVRRRFNFASKRAGTIARTEVGAAVEGARAAGRSQAKVPAKSWLWSRRETGRPQHRDTEEATMASPVPNDQDFTIAQTGHRAPHPRASNVPSEDINCGCTTIGRYPGDQARDLRGLAHLLRHGFLPASQP